MQIGAWARAFPEKYQRDNHRQEKKRVSTRKKKLSHFLVLLDKPELVNSLVILLILLLSGLVSPKVLAWPLERSCSSTPVNSLLLTKCLDVCHRMRMSFFLAPPLQRKSGTGE